MRKPTDGPINQQGDCDHGQRIRRYAHARYGIGGLSAKGLEDAFRQSDATMSLLDYNASPGQALRDAYRSAGFDAVVLTDPAGQFTGMDIGRGTQHMTM